MDAHTLTPSIAMPSAQNDDLVYPISGDYYFHTTLVK